MASNQKSLEASNETQGDERLRQKFILFCQVILYAEQVTSTSPATPEKQEAEPTLETTSAPKRDPIRVPGRFGWCRNCWLSVLDDSSAGDGLADDDGILARRAQVV